MTQIAVSQRPTVAKRGRSWKWIAGIGGAAIVVVLVAVGMMLWQMNAIPANLDLSTTRASVGGAFKATIRPAVEPIPINRLHSWTLHVETPDGKPVEHATIKLQGDMPQHGHGMPTVPEVSQYLGHGDYAVEGMKFQMGGWWVVDFDISAGDKIDRVSFNLVLR